MKNYILITGLYLLLAILVLIGSIYCFIIKDYSFTIYTGLLGTSLLFYINKRMKYGTILVNKLKENKKC